MKSGQKSATILYNTRDCDTCIAIIRWGHSQMHDHERRDCNGSESQPAATAGTN